MNNENHFEPASEVIQNLRKLSTRMTLFQQIAAHSLGIVQTDFKTADILNETGPLTAGELAKVTGLTTGAVTALIDRLEQAKLVKREKDPDDRRRVMIVPIKDKQPLIRNYYVTMNQEISELCSHYNESELALLTDFIKKISMIHEKEIQRMSSEDVE